MKKGSNTFALAYLMYAAPMSTNTVVRSPEDAYNVCKDSGDFAAEAFTVMCINSKNQLIAGGIISIGIQDTCLCHPREVFREAISRNAVAVILVHNHPSGDPTPSAEDISITRQLVQAGQIVGIKVMDHIIIGRPSPDRPRAFLSIRESGIVSFDT